MTQDSNVIRFPKTFGRIAATSRSRRMSPVLLAELQIMDRQRLQRIADLAYDGLLKDRESETLEIIATLFTAD